MRERNRSILDAIHLYEQLSDKWTLRSAFKAVKGNNGANGVDGVTIENFEINLEENLDQLQYELIMWSYRPKPVRRVEIPKPRAYALKKI
jgi:RNA-directed DNA polymerase